MPLPPPVTRAVRPLRLLGDPTLHSPCDPVTDFGPGLARLVEDL
ncbi:peptide deformylase, partial [Streptomyces niveus]